MIKKVLVSQPAPSSEKSPYYEIARKHGVEFVLHPERGQLLGSVYRRPSYAEPFPETVYVVGVQSP